MTYKEIFELENRNEKNIYDIIFIKENDGWWRANEWSAYLANLIQDKLSIKNKLNVVKKPYKEIEDGLIMIGLKMSSFEKYFKNAISVNIFENKEDNKYVIFNSEKFLIENNETIKYDKYKDILCKWKENFKYKKDFTTNNNEVDKIFTNISGINKKLYIEVLSYPLENKTPIENIEFIRSLKNEVVNLI